MKNKLSLLILTLLLVACGGVTPATPASTLAVLPDNCQKAGTVQFSSLKLDYGIAYDYGVYLPPCFDASAGKTYPIIYLLPGRSSLATAWLSPGVAPIADNLILTHEMPPFIIVATSSTEFDMLAETIINTLIPYIESNYPVNPERRYHAVAGGSLGGIGAYRIGLSQPDHFSSIGMFGSGTISGEEPRIRAWIKALTLENKPRVFLNTGFADSYMLDRAHVMMTLLDEGGISHTQIFTEGEHTYTYWLTNMTAYFRWVALDW